MGASKVQSEQHKGALSLFGVGAPRLGRQLQVSEEGLNHETEVRHKRGQKEVSCLLQAGCIKSVPFFGSWRWRSAPWQTASERRQDGGHGAIEVRRSECKVE